MKVKINNLTIHTTLPYFVFYEGAVYEITKEQAKAVLDDKNYVIVKGEDDER